MAGARPSKEIIRKAASSFETREWRPLMMMPTRTQKGERRSVE